MQKGVNAIIKVALTKQENVCINDDYEKRSKCNNYGSLPKTVNFCLISPELSLSWTCSIRSSSMSTDLLRFHLQLAFLPQYWAENCARGELLVY